MVDDCRRRLPDAVSPGIQPGFLGIWEKTRKIFNRVLNDPHREGDGRVPLASALLEHVGDIRYVKGVHGGLSNIPAVYEDVFRCLKNETMQLPRTPPKRLASIWPSRPRVGATPQTGRRHGRGHRRSRLVAARKSFGRAHEEITGCLRPISFQASAAYICYEVDLP